MPEENKVVIPLIKQRMKVETEIMARAVAGVRLSLSIKMTASNAGAMIGLAAKAQA